ncbi:UDP-N-acetylmuramoyl-tripeptide--D-alanyl-D-alanine ligase [Cetobacterium sp. ZWU0022]|uniref:UDP-N-acetylmuramoyl-tripeptide--D-alanyl-D- alanine ligase n=1 Tax=Cetobacterium sp. ZWU0022 TaxID=1340502 RepID=UPI00068DD7F7|nr:UDP-N-acetylmuramoyl-tripeptide--D-alanyl-D-alanine ligase [Cetobacterium sp. ZWU0022]
MKIKKGDVKVKVFTEVLINYFQKLNSKLIDNRFITDVQMDSKKVTKGSLFIAINNGNNYVSEALKNGAELVICDREIEELKYSNVIKVENSIQTLQELAKLYRKKLNLKVIAITGSEGKTTTKDLIHGILKKKYRVKKTLGNHNNHIGLPYTILQLSSEDEIAVLEMGMSDLGEIDLLSKIAQPDYAVITNIGDSHLEFLKNRDNVFKAKTELLKYVDTKRTLLYGDDPYFKTVEGIKVGFDKNNNYIINETKDLYEGMIFTLNEEKYFLPLNGLYNVINASFGIALGKMFNMSYTEIKEALECIEITGMRFEKIIKDGVLYINDAYNASPVSMKMALQAFSSLPLNKQKVVVLADALELGEKEIEYHIEVLSEALKHNFYRIFIYGERMKKASEILKNEAIESFDSKNEIKNAIQQIENVGVLLKGSRGMKLEEIIISKE